ncbi:uncharacterized protein LOC108679665 isoform X2 [Hyalella azteca]|nr:uncharacterized protein LOC108679665 isoform X2 [Hyalella azteca]
MNCRRSKRFRTKVLSYWDFERIVSVETDNGSVAAVVKDIPGERTIILQGQESADSDIEKNSSSIFFPQKKIPKTNFISKSDSSNIKIQANRIKTKMQPKPVKSSRKRSLFAGQSLLNKTASQETNFKTSKNFSELRTRSLPLLSAINMSRKSRKPSLESNFQSSHQKTYSMEHSKISEEIPHHMRVRTKKTSVDKKLSDVSKVKGRSESQTEIPDRSSIHPSMTKSSQSGELSKTTLVSDFADCSNENINKTGADAKESVHGHHSTDIESSGLPHSPILYNTRSSAREAPLQTEVAASTENVLSETVAAAVTSPQNELSKTAADKVDQLMNFLVAGPSKNIEQNPSSSDSRTDSESEGIKHLRNLLNDGKNLKFYPLGRDVMQPATSRDFYIAKGAASGNIETFFLCLKKGYVAFTTPADTTLLTLKGSGQSSIVIDGACMFASTLVAGIQNEAKKGVTIALNVDEDCSELLICIMLFGSQN